MTSSSANRLATWLGGMLIDPDGSQLAALGGTVQRLATGLDVAHALTLAGYAHGLPGTEAAGHALVAAAADGVPVGAPGDRKPVVLAAAALVRLLDEHDESEQAAAAAVAVQSALLLRPPALTELEPLARRAVIEIGDAQRRRPTAPGSARAAVDEQLGKNVGFADAATPVDNATARSAFVAVRKAVRAGADAADEARRRLANHVELVDEEADALWWALGGRSELAGRAWSELDEACVLVSAFELAGKLKRFPPPRATGALLRR